MRPGRELDTRVAQEIFGYEVYAKKRILHENTEKGERPLRNYTRDIEWAWLVAEKMRVSLIPIENGNWFAFAGPLEGWSGPEAFLEFLRGGDFSFAGAAVGESAAQAICEAALVANQKRKMQEGGAETTQAPISSEIAEEDSVANPEEIPTSIH